MHMHISLAACTTAGNRFARRHRSTRPRSVAVGVSFPGRIAGARSGVGGTGRSDRSIPTSGWSSADRFPGPLGRRPTFLTETTTARRWSALPWPAGTAGGRLQLQSLPGHGRGDCRRLGRHRPATRSGRTAELQSLHGAGGRPCGAGIRVLPQSLHEAIQALEADPLFAEALGHEFMQEFFRLKRMEWVEYQRHVSDWEVNRYLEFY